MGSVLFKKQSTWLKGEKTLEKPSVQMAVVTSCGREFHRLIVSTFEKSATRERDVASSL